MAILNECPNCGSRSIKIHRETGCFWVVFVFVSLGLGLLMYPFLPRIATCRKCGMKWKI